MAAQAKPIDSIGKAMTAAANSDDQELRLSMREVLLAFLQETGGTSGFGREMARLLMSPETSAASKVSTGANVMKMLGVYGDESDVSEMVPDEMLERWEELQRQETRSEIIRSMEGGG